MKKALVGLFLSILPLFVLTPTANAGWVNGYFRNNGTYVNGYYRTEPDYYKWNNYSFNNDWSDAYNDRSWYRDYGYDPEPWDDEYTWGSTYNYGWSDDDDYGNYDYSDDWDW